jgi:hypothetical protein
MSFFETKSDEKNLNFENKFLKTVKNYAKMKSQKTENP